MNSGGLRQVGFFMAQQNENEMALDLIGIARRSWYMRR